jgi:6-phosphogluconate dehydrogenase
MNATYDLGMVGLGVMGRNLLLNFADHHFHVAGLDTDAAKVEAFVAAAAGKAATATTDAGQFVQLLRAPRTVVLLVPAGKVVDRV